MECPDCFAMVANPAAQAVSREPRKATGSPRREARVAPKNRSSERAVRAARYDWTVFLWRTVGAMAFVSVLLLLISWFFYWTFLVGVVYGLVLVAGAFIISSSSLRVHHGQPASDFDCGFGDVFAYVFRGAGSYPHGLIVLILGVITLIASPIVANISLPNDNPPANNGPVVAGNPLNPQPKQNPNPIPQPPKQKGNPNPIPKFPNFPQPKIPKFPMPKKPPFPFPKVKKPKQMPKFDGPKPAFPAKRPTVTNNPRQMLSADMIEGLVAYYPFDEDAGDHVFDWSDNKSFGTIFGAERVSGIRGKALRFDGKSALLQIERSHQVDFDAHEPFTFALWFKAEQTSGTLLTFRDNASNGSVIGLRFSNNRLQARIRQGGTLISPASAASEPNVQTGKWYHVALTRDVNGALELFVDGQSVRKVRPRFSNGRITSELRYLGVEPLRGSLRASPIDKTNFQRVIDELCVYNRQLEAYDLAILSGRENKLKRPPIAKATFPAKPPVVTNNPRSLPPASNLKGLTAYWSMDEGEGDHAFDWSGNKLIAIVRGAQWTGGVRGKALQFDGRESYLEMSKSKLLNFAANSPFTVAAWMKTTENDGTIISFRHEREQCAMVHLMLVNKKLRAWVRQDGDPFTPTGVTTKKPVNDDQWHHVAFSRGQNGIVTLYVDGTLIGSGKPIFPRNGSRGSVTTDLRALGLDWFAHKKNKGGADMRWFAGSIDEFCVFHRILTAAEIRELAGRN